MKPHNMLEAIEVERRFGGVRALDRCDVRVPAGSITGIIGPNGAGKSTLFNVVSGLIPPQSGRVTLDGADVTGRGPREMAVRGLVRTFQISRELGELTVLENLLTARPNQSGESAWRALLLPGLVHDEERRAVEQARALLERVKLWHLADAPASTLSGGQKKLLELARALMLKPKVILLDEPAAGVNPSLIRELSEFIVGLRDEGVTFAIVEHNMDLVAEICDPVYVLAEGRTLVHGTYREVTADRRVVNAYLGGVI